MTENDKALKKVLTEESVSLTLYDGEGTLFLDPLEDGISITLTDRESKKQYDFFIGQKQWDFIKNYLESEFTNEI